MKTIKERYRIDRKHVNYLRVVVESYDGSAVVSTIDPCRAIVELSISPGCRSVVALLLDDLRIREGLDLERLAPGSG